MRIKETIKKSGYFWLPSAPERKIPGTLSITDGGDIELEVIGLFDESIEALNGNDDLRRIVGHIENDGLVTLDNCFYRVKNISFGGISKSLVCVNKALVGVAYETGESVSFNTFIFSVEGIDEWVGISGIKVNNFYESKTAKIEYTPPEEITINLNNGMQLFIRFSWTYPGYPNQTEAKITQKIYFDLVSTEERELNDFIFIAHKITTLLCFSIDKTVCIEHVTATANSISRDIGDGKSKPVSIKIYYPSLPYSKEEPKIEWRRMLFRYGNIANNAEKVINNWIDAYDKIGVALDLYFSTTMGAQKYLDGKFLALAQGLETYHRRISNEKMMDEEKFQNLVKSLHDLCPKENQEWLAGRLKHGNEIAFTKRIKSIIDPFKAIAWSSAERGKIIRNIVDTRNYLTHFDESLKPKAVSGIDLLHLCSKMEILFQLHFLYVLGFTQDEIKSIFDNCYQLKQKLS